MEENDKKSREKRTTIEKFQNSSKYKKQFADLANSGFKLAIAYV